MKRTPVNMFSHLLSMIIVQYSNNGCLTMFESRTNRSHMVDQNNINGLHTASANHTARIQPKYIRKTVETYGSQKHNLQLLGFLPSYIIAAAKHYPSLKHPSFFIAPLNAKNTRIARIQSYLAYQSSWSVKQISVINTYISPLPLLSHHNVWYQLYLQ